MAQNAPVLLLGAALFASFVLLLALATGLTFFQDSWAFLMHRRGFSADVFLEPHNEHIVLIPVVVEKLLLAIFGMSSAAPEYAVLGLLLATTAALVFVYVRRRLGPWPALFAAVLLLFVGPAWQVLLWPFEIGFAGSVMAGVAVLLALERDEERWDIAACVFLTVSLGFSTLGLSFAAAAFVDLLLKHRSRGLRRAYILVIPIVLFVAWYVGWGHTAESHLGLDNILASPHFLLDGLASSLDTVLGLSTIDVHGIGQPEWGRPLLVAAAVLVGYGQWRRRGFSPRVWPIAAATASFWLLAGFNYIPGREAVASRYAYAGAVFILLLAADLLKGVRFGRTALWIGALVTAAAVASNLVPLKQGKDYLREQAVLTKSDLGAMQIASRTIAPYFGLTPEIAGTPSLIDIDAADYFPVERQYGSPAYSPAALETAPEIGRRQADIVLGYALPITASEKRGAATGAAAENCVSVPGDGSRPELPVASGTTRIVVPAGPPASLSLRRFAVGEYPVAVAGGDGDSVTYLHIPRDSAPQPWNLQVEASQGAQVCR